METPFYSQWGQKLQVFCKNQPFNSKLQKLRFIDYLYVNSSGLDVMGSIYPLEYTVLFKF